jgi:hypothetical protein
LAFISLLLFVFGFFWIDLLLEWAVFGQPYSRVVICGCGEQSGGRDDAEDDQLVAVVLKSLAQNNK